MKKTLKFILLIGASLVLAGCEVPNINNYFDTSIIAKDTIALQATTALTLVNSFADSPSLQQVEQELNIADDKAAEIPIATLDFFLNNDVAFNVEKTTSDREGYVYLDVISFTISKDVTISYALYYNLETSDVEIINEGAMNAFRNNGNGHKDDERGNGKRNHANQQNGKRNGKGNNGSGKGKHNHYRISGLAIVGEDEYRFVAKTERNDKGDKAATALKFRLYKDEENYIVIKHERELFEEIAEAQQQYVEKLSYVVVENNEVVKQFKHELVKAQDEFTLSVIIDGTKYVVKSFTIDEKVFLQVTLCDGETFIYEKIVTIDTETEITTVTFVLQ